MLTFKRTSENNFALFDDEKEIAWVQTDGNLIKNVTYEDEKTNARYGDFTLRSIAYALRNHNAEIKSAFYDERLERIGFEKTHDGMKANALKINFDTCCCQKGEKSEN